MNCDTTNCYSCYDCAHSNIFESAHEWLSFCCLAQGNKDMGTAINNCKFFEKYKSPEECQDDALLQMKSHIVGYISQSSVPVCDRADMVMDAVKKYINGWYAVDYTKFNERRMRERMNKPRIELYTQSGCPQCELIEKLLQESGLEYYNISDIDDLTKRGVTHTPMMSVNDGELMSATTAINWIKNYKA